MRSAAGIRWSDKRACTGSQLVRSAVYHADMSLSELFFKLYCGDDDGRFAGVQTPALRFQPSPLMDSDPTPANRMKTNEKRGTAGTLVLQLQPNIDCASGY